MTRLDLTTYAAWVGMAILVVGFWLWIGANVWLIGATLLDNAGTLNGCETLALSAGECVALAQVGAQ